MTRLRIVRGRGIVAVDMDDRRTVPSPRAPARKTAARRKRTYVVRPLPPRDDATGERAGAARPDRQEAGPAASPSVQVTPEQRRQWIAEAAYYRAERRGFVGGDPGEDWRAAEAEIDARLLGVVPDPEEP